jgi:hypothetical protein
VGVPLFLFLSSVRLLNRPCHCLPYTQPHSPQRAQIVLGLDCAQTCHYISGLFEHGLRNALIQQSQTPKL